MSEVFHNISEFVSPPMNPKLCQFCLLEAAYAPLEEMEQLGVNVFFCRPCHAEYLYFSENDKPKEETASVSLYTDINGKIYRWTTSSQRGTLWLIKTPGKPGARSNRDLEFVYGLSGDQAIPQLTPSNIREKIRTWLIYL